MAGAEGAEEPAEPPLPLLTKKPVPEDPAVPPVTAPPEVSKVKSLEWLQLFALSQDQSMT